MLVPVQPIATSSSGWPAASMDSSSRRTNGWTQTVEDVRRGEALDGGVNVVPDGEFSHTWASRARAQAVHGLVDVRQFCADFLIASPRNP